MGFEAKVFLEYTAKFVRKAVVNYEYNNVLYVAVTIRFQWRIVFTARDPRVRSARGRVQ